MTLRCLLFGHRRSRSRATFDEKLGRWTSECKRCCIPMMREADGTWHATSPPPVGKLLPIDCAAASSTAPGRSPGEPPFIAAGAANSTNGSGSVALEHSKETVELSAS